ARRDRSESRAVAADEPEARWTPYKLLIMNNLDIGKVCGVVAAPDARSMQRQLQAGLRFTKTFELRLDWLASEEEIGRFLKWLGSQKLRANLIATCRREKAGGRYRGTIADEMLRLAEAIAAGCRWYDFEIESSAECPPELIEVLLGGGRRIA